MYQKTFSDEMLNCFAAQNWIETVEDEKTQKIRSQKCLLKGGRFSGDWVNISNGLKLVVFQLQMVPGNS